MMKYQFKFTLRFGNREDMEFEGSLIEDPLKVLSAYYALSLPGIIGLEIYRDGNLIDISDVERDIERKFYSRNTPTAD